MTPHLHHDQAYRSSRQRLDCGSPLPLSLTRRTVPQSALTKIDVITIIATLTILAFLISPALLRSRAESSKTHCVNNLKNIGLSFRLYSTDSSPDFATTRLLQKKVPIESIGAVTVFRLHSNELSTPRILICPRDSKRQPAREFESLVGENISYFVSLSAQVWDVNTLTTGDRNLLFNSEPITGLFPLLTNMGRQISWSKDIHNEMGHATTSDGSVQQMNSVRLQQAIANQDLATNYISIP